MPLGKCDARGSMDSWEEGMLVGTKLPCMGGGSASASASAQTGIHGEDREAAGWAHW